MNVCPHCGFERSLEGHCPQCGSSKGEPRSPSAAGTFLLPALLAPLAIVLCLFLFLALPRGGADPVAPVLEEALGAPLPATAPQPLLVAAKAEPPIATPAPPAAKGVVKALPRGKARAPVAAPPPAPLPPPPAEPEARNRPPTESREAYFAWMLANSRETQEQLERKWERSRALLERGEISKKAVLEAFLYTPREYFARPYNAKKAYDDTAIPIGHGQTISGPHMVSHMTDSIAPLPGDRILEIGTGSGYQSALLSELSDKVFTIEIVPGLAAETEAIYRKWEKSYPEYSRVTRRNADGYFGWPEQAPFDKIIVTAGIDHIPPPLLAQLAPWGVMVIPVGPPSGQTVLRIVKRPTAEGGFSFERSDIYHGRKVVFVPFTSEGGKAHSLDDASGPAPRGR